MQFAKLDPQLPAALENFPSSVVYEPLSFIGARGIVSLKKGVIRSHPLSSYGYFADPICLLAITLKNGL